MHPDFCRGVEWRAERQKDILKPPILNLKQLGKYTSRKISPTKSLVPDRKKKKKKKKKKKEKKNMTPTIYH
ncbi:hypothetical protein VN97_g118 [Penicillium thymicola]|uniref:Uncharacterized protein n=1 Tax=Penicillium thymicola TaxID=293382 RepID=A0AAI9TUN5_PENTH|nr:hypothetical protein VN97_g118 [Penicillium thymicola]